MSHQPPEHKDTPEPALNRLRRVVAVLRGPGGCPWDMEQTHASLVPNLLEEAYEIADALQSDDVDHMCEELGDLLLQAFMHAEIAAESEDGFTLDDVADGISDKLIRRHPHVFAESDAEDTEAVLRQWDAIKQAEKAGNGERPRVLDNISKGLPALIRATKIQKKAARVGFDWPEAEGALEKIREEIDEVAAAAADEEKLAEEIGDLLFAVVNFARKMGLDAETLLANANNKFVRRFEAVEDRFHAEGRELESGSLAEMDAAWDLAKRSEP